MNINFLFEGIMKAINQYADEIVAERLQLQISQIRRTPETERKNSENLRLGEKQNDGNFLAQKPECGIGRRFRRALTY